MSQETKDKIRKALTGKPKSLEHNKKVSEAKKGVSVKQVFYWKGKKMPDDLKKKFSDAKKGKPAWNKGLTGIVKHSEETKQKMSDSRKNYFIKNKL